jgi:lipoprotein-anchoring transpeptidase ErfK/SrfK
MRQRSFIAVALAVALLILGAVGVYAYDKTNSDVLASGVTAGGVDISGLHPDKARAKLQRELAEPLQKALVVKYAGRRYKLSPSQAKVRVAVDQMVQQGLDASRKGNLISRTTRALTGGSVHANIPVEVTYSKPAVAKFVNRVRKSINRPAQDANLGFSGGAIQKVSGHDGRTLDKGALSRQVQAELVEPTSDHRVKAPVERVKPKVTTAELARRYPTVIVVNRSAFKLTLYKNLEVATTYRIAVGRQGLETPAGRYAIQDKQVNPSWHVPNSPWAGKLAGKVIPPGPQDPIKARWMGIAGGAGIHGTEEIGSLGTAASHGCIRMAIPDVIALFDRVQVGNPVFIA